MTQMLLPIIASRLSQLACIVLEAVNSSISSASDERGHFFTGSTISTERKYTVCPWKCFGMSRSVQRRAAHILAQDRACSLMSATSNYSQDC